MSTTTYTNTQRSKAKHTIKKILAMTEAAGCTPAQAATAQTRAQVWMDKYGFTPADFAAKPDGFTIFADAMAKAGNKPQPKAKPAKPAAKGARRGPAPEYADTQVITLLVANPKRPGSKAFARYANYKDGMTVAQALAAGLTREDFRWDVEKGHIAIA
jgi:hypothetical protein